MMQWQEKPDTEKSAVRLQQCARARCLEEEQANDLTEQTSKSGQQWASVLKHKTENILCCGDTRDDHSARPTHFSVLTPC